MGHPREVWKGCSQATDTALDLPAVITAKQGSRGSMNNWATRQSPMKRNGWKNANKERVKKAEERFQYQVIELARHLGWFPVHILNMGGTAAGVPDLFLFRERLVWIELKAYSDATGKAGQLSPEQERFFEVLHDAGQEAYVVWDDDDGWAELKRILAKPGVPQ